MGAVYTKRYQDCDICHDCIAIGKDELPELILPATYKHMDGGTNGVATVKLSVCEDCLNKVHAWIRKKYMIDKIEYGGTTVKVIDEELN